MKKLVWIGCLSYLLIGLAHVVLGSVLPVVLDHYEKDYSQGGMLIFTQFAGFLVGVLVSPLLNRRFGKKGGLLIAIGLLLAAEVMYTLLPPWGWMYVIAIAAGFGFGMIEAVIGTIIISAITDQTAVAMSRLEVFFGVGALLMPLVASGLIAAGYWQLSFLVVAVFALITFILWTKGSFGELDRVLNERGPAPGTPTKEGSSRALVQGKDRIILGMFLLFFFLYVGTEMSLANFMPSILIEKLSMSESGAALSVTCFWVAMSVGRLFAGYVAERFHYRVYVLFSCIATTVLLMLLPLADSIWASFTIIALLGLAMSGLFSIALVFVSKLLPGTEESTPSMMIAAGGVGGAVLPLLTGAVLDRMTVGQASWLFAIFFAGLVFISLFAYNWQRKPKAARVVHR
ncbi:FHS family glucose/mannose:H+ symporter-like MFS transporter [Paenibacillus phyllosphaerae]|uniref:FHS family glucose/mannose:H+ symporter-like MFS transporter n=1 Tax=Paenibacillus phyllosphaerae TaxID=274593 RepID=A0A7W5AYV6_9BACL|nr:MFS transporter [Paenibacillus phyllosphaerae]MBB3110821.1 FHS family glucose/mannose:H+ symporter-like MFS transporter [Paenibacillus phyllosphaerae]